MPDGTVRYVVSVLARDHVGIIAGVSEALYCLGGNIEALSQTVVGRWFTMIVRAEFPADMTDQAVKDAVERPGGLQAIVGAVDAVEATAHVEGDPYVVTVTGDDRPGIVYRFARCFAERGVNIEDVWNEVQDGRFVEIFSVTVPPDVDPKTLRYDLEQIAGELSMTVRLQHRDIFTATTSLSVHTRR
ncbi:MAG: glycine cleavage system transcriptional repressor [Candidatus Hydrogenedentes bacterium]|nr:glycine cleavage system transcriptional repressor [Candidatus Hydrogenedentota bacterium]